MSLRLGVLLGLRGLAFCGLGLVGLGVFRLGYLGRCDGRTFGDCFDIEGVDRGVARADGLACLVDAVTELAIVNDLAAFGRLDGGVLNLDGADCLAVSAHGTGKDCRCISFGRYLAADDRDDCGCDALAGLGDDADVLALGFAPRLAILVFAVGDGAVAVLDIAGYGLDNGVADVDVAALLVGSIVSGGKCSRNLAFRKRVHGGAVLDDDVVLVGEEGVGATVSAFTCTDRHVCMIEGDALVGIDAIFNTVYVEGGVCGCEAALGLDGSVFLGACLDLAAVRDVDIAAAPKGLTIG